MIFQFFRSIRVLFSVYLGIILLFIYLGFHFYQGDKDREFSERSRELGSIAKLKYSAVLQWYTERYADARYIFSNESLHQILNTRKSSLGDSSEIYRLLFSIYKNHDYSNLFLLNSSSGDIMKLNPSGSNEIMKDSLNVALSDNRIVNSDFYYDKNLHQTCLDMYVPILISTEKKLVVVLKVDPYKILFPTVSNWYIDASSGESLVVTLFGDSVNYISPLRFYHNNAQILKKSVNDPDLPAVRFIKGAKGILAGTDYRGAEVLADVHRIENTPWYLVTKIDLAEIYEPVTSSTLNNLLILGLLISLGGILLLYYYTRSNYKTLRKISETEKKFKNIFNNSTEAIVILDKERIIDCNSGAEELYGLPRKKIIGRTPGSMSPEYQPGHKRSNELASEFISKALSGKPQKFEWIHSSDGSLIYTDITLTMIEVDGEKLVAGFLHNITERKLIEDALYESEKMYRSIFDSAPVGIYQSTVEGKIIKANNALAKLLGYNSPDELIRINISEIYFEKKDRQNLINEFEPTGSVSDREVQWKKKDGTIIWIQLNAFAVKDELGNTKHFEGYIRDITSRRLAEDKLKESEAQYRDLVENINDIVFSLDEEGIIKFISSAVEKSTGYKMHELVGKPFTEFIHPGDLEIATKNFHNLSVNKSALSEYRIITKSGEYRNLSASSTGIFEEGNFTGIRGILTDISEKKVADEKLKMQTHLLNETQHLARLGSWEHDFEKDHVIWSDEIYQILGASKGTLENTREAFNEFVHKDDLSGLLSAYEDSRQEGVDGFEIEHRIVRKDNGRVRFVYQECRHFRNAEGKIIRSMGMVQDITERVVAGKHIQTLTKAVEQSPVCVIITDLHGNIQYVNNKFTEVTGYSMNEVIDKNPRILKSGSQSEEFYRDLWETVLSGNTWSGELHNKKKNGELYWENAIISPMVDAEGRILNFVAVKEDITEKKKMIEDLVEAKDKAEEANRLKSSFLANMSHELRTPMVGILGYTDILVSELSNPEHMELAKMVLSSGKRLIETLNSILDLSSIEAKKMELKYESVDVIKILKESVTLFIPGAASKGLYIKTVLPNENLVVNSDREILRKIFNNLINNAVKYTQSGGLTIELSFTNNGDEKYLIVSFTDTGIGIPAEYHEIIFEPFRQVSEGYTRKFEGSGLGLSITNKLVRILDGNIFLESKPDKGSRFIVKIPVTFSVEPSHKEKKEMPHLRSIELPENLRILLVEDDELNADIILSYLKPLCSIDHVSDGVTAVNYCKTQQYDSILMDINLKGMNGIEALEKIRKQDEYYLTVPVIAVTALAMIGDREKLLAVGFDNYLSKPFERKELLETISNTLKSPVLKPSSS